MPFFTVEGDTISQGKLDSVAKAVRQLSQSQREKAHARWTDNPLKSNGSEHAAAVPRQYRGNASKTKTNIPPKSPKGDRQKLNGKGNPFPADFPYDHRLTFSENRKALDAWKAAQEQPA